MTRRPQAFGLVSKSTGLSPAHIALIKLLAKMDVENYSREMEAMEMAEPRSIDQRQR